MNYRDTAVKLFNNLSIIYNHPDQKKLVSLTRGELCVLVALAIHGDLSPTELIRYTDSSSAHIAKTIRNLITKETVERTDDPSDKRRAIISITEKGRKQVRDIYNSIIDNLTDILKKLNEEEVTSLMSITDHIIRMEEADHD